MGCDIHIYTEVKDKDRWLPIDWWTQTKYPDPEDNTGATEFSCIEVYDGRNYALFSKMTGCVRGYDSDPVSDLKGIPDDLNPLVYKIWEYEKEYCHSSSWLTIKEIQDYIESHSVDSMPARCKTCRYWMMYEEDDYGETEEVLGQLRSIIDEVKKRLTVYLYSEDDAEKMLTEKPEEVRIVFWFDN